MAKVKRYAALFTKKVHAKQKCYADGFVRLHHFNSKLLLLDDDSRILASTFYDVPHARRAESKITSNGQIDDAFVLEDGEEITFDDDTFFVVVGELMDESETNIEAVKSAAKIMKQSAKNSAALWGNSVDYTGMESSNRLTSTPGASSGGYRGFGIAPPRSYEVAKEVAAEKEKRKSASERRNGTATSNPSRDTPRSTPTTRPSPYPVSRPSPAISTPSRQSLPPNISSLDPSTTLSGTPLRPLAATHKSLLSSGKKSIASPFKPPSFIGRVQKSDR